MWFYASGAACVACLLFFVSSNRHLIRGDTDSASHGASLVGQVVGVVTHPSSTVHTVVWACLRFQRSLLSAFGRFIWIFATLVQVALEQVRTAAARGARAWSFIFDLVHQWMREAAWASCTLPCKLNCPIWTHFGQ